MNLVLLFLASQFGLAALVVPYCFESRSTANVPHAVNLARSLLGLALLTAVRFRYEDRNELRW